MTSISPWQAAHEAFACEHSVRELRVKTVSNGTRQYRRQCIRCGDGGISIRKEDAARECRLADIQPFDEELQPAWQQQVRQLANELRTQQTESWFAEHDAYLRTAAWLRRRDYVFARDNYRCQAFLPGCTRRAQHVHHLTYRYWRNEPLFDLIAVCEFCHDELTKMDRERRGAA